ncbi:hypothetical protein [Klebsiella pasteurii]|uniref:hypothetical protein n=1 Tax=Klebsiella pasteurii TaxID=2587529 RepID=UPI00115C5039|nr:hypothetical protein [Klebsiella pasteurii]VUS46232.1 hypothetical protein SB6420_01326 [Klebsiella pasteurii]HBX4909499.1 hypothetical protein [Klebsiella pneumoniae]HBX4914177.1 hypothetical protein [Klebsiella pneumoniae]
MKIIEIDEWDEFEKRLVLELDEIEFDGLVLARNFSLETYDVNNENSDPVDRFSLAKNTGTDRDNDSPFWNVPGHDYEHDINCSGKSPTDIIYAYVVKIDSDGYSVYYLNDNAEKMDLTDGLNECDGILIYDQSKLEHVSKNEHWFSSSPLDALLMIFKLKDC